MTSNLGPNSLQGLETTLWDRIARGIDPQPEEFQDYNAWLKHVSPTWQWDMPHSLLIQKHLDMVTAGEIDHLMINCPPRHGKTELVTVRYLANRLERDPNIQVILGAYNQQLATKFSRKVRRVGHGRIEMSKERNASHDWETTGSGGLKAIGVGSGVTGTGGDIILIDDPVKNREEANSRTYQNKVYDWYTDDIYTRRAPGCAIILIMTRWSDGDLAGRILESDNAGDWTVLNLPALAHADDQLGRKEGEALWPDRFTREQLLKIKKLQGPSFESLYQGQPVSQEGAIFKLEHWQYYRELPKFKRTIHSWDTAFKKGQHNDYSVCTVGHETDTGIYIPEVYRARLEFPELKRTMMSMADRDNPQAILIEDKASGQSLIQELKRDTRLPIIPIKISTDKESRAHSAAPMVESGNVYLREGGSWVHDFIHELARFPAGVHDDQVDSFDQLINWLTKPKPQWVY